MDKIITNNGLRPIAPYLAHHGIKGQEWYHRRYQNYDGSYTEAGRLRYGIGKSRTLKNNVQRRKSAEKMIKYSNKANKLQKKANTARVKNPNANVVKREQKAEAYRQKQYEKAHELVSESEELHSAIDAYDMAENRYEDAVNAFLSDKDAYAKAVEEQIAEDRKHGFYGGTEEDFRNFYNGDEGQQTILERFESENENVQKLLRDVKSKEKEFQDTAEALFDNALDVFGSFEVDRKKILGKGPYTLSEELAERELHGTLLDRRKQESANKSAEEAVAKDDFSNLPKEEQNRYLQRAAEKQFEDDHNSGELDKLNKARVRKGMAPLTKEDYIHEAIDGDGNEGKHKAWQEYAEDKKNGKIPAKTEKPEYIDKVETKNGDTRYFYDKSELKAYKDGKSGATNKDLDDAYKKMRSSSKTDEEKDLKEHYWTNARDNDRWDINFLEAVQNSVILDKNDKKSLLTEYAKYLSDPMDYWENERDKLKEL